MRSARVFRPPRPAVRVASVALLAGVGPIVVPATAAAAGDAHSGSASLLFGVAVLVAAAKVGGLIAERWRQPPVLGELLVGIGLANLVFPLFGGGLASVGSDPTFRFLAEIGALILLFDVGLETDLRALARVGWSSLLVALIGVVVPVALGWAASAWLLPDRSWIVHLFVGATLSATSVGITARVLKDLGVMRSPEAQVILGAAILDDVLGLVVLAVLGGLVVTAVGEPSVSLPAIIGIVARAALFLGGAALAGHYLSRRIVRAAAATGHPETILALGLSLCFALAFVAERIGLAGILGAFAAGIVLDPYGEGVTASERATLAELLHPLSALFVPLFFVLMGLQVELASLGSGATLTLAVVLTVCAVAGKLACGLGVIRRGVDRLAVGMGMLPRGEVGLIFAGIGTTLVLGGQPVLSGALFSAVVFVVLVTTIVAPTGLRWAFDRRAGKDVHQPTGC